MSGKIIKLNDYKFTYGKETVYINVYAAFKSNKTSNKYVIYSYDNTKLCYGSLFTRDKEIVFMISKDDDKEIVNQFINEFINEKLSDDFEIISLDKIESIQVIDESIYENIIDMNKLFDIAIPKPKVETETTDVKPKKNISISAIFFIIFLLVLAAFFFVNPEVINGKKQKYVCTKSYTHDQLPVNVNEEMVLIFDNKNVIDSINITSDYVFTDINYYKEFKEKNYSYKYFKNIESMKENDEEHSYRLFSVIDTESDYFLPTDKDELISHYNNEGYKCTEVEME